LATILSLEREKKKKKKPTASKNKNNQNRKWIQGGAKNQKLSSTNVPEPKSYLAPRVGPGKSKKAN